MLELDNFTEKLNAFTRRLQEKKNDVSLFLKGRPGLAFCDDCLRKMLSIHRSNLPEKGMADNAVALGFERKQDTCIVCGQNRITTKAREPE